MIAAGRASRLLSERPTFLLWHLLHCTWMFHSCGSHWRVKPHGEGQTLCTGQPPLSMQQWRCEEDPSHVRKAGPRHQQYQLMFHAGQTCTLPFMIKIDSNFSFWFSVSSWTPPLPRQHAYTEYSKPIHDSFNFLCIWLGIKNLLSSIAYSYL